METYYRICIKDFRLEDKMGNILNLKKGKKYLTSREEDEKVMVFTRFWVWVPLNIFANAERFT